jgi:antirestriction protein ArdC
MKKQLTAEQIAARDERRRKFRELVKRVAGMSPAQRLELCSRAAAVLTCEGRALSPVNTCLCVMQSPGVTVVGGFRQWLRSGRCVRKGEHGLTIWIPLSARKTDGTSPELIGEQPGEGVSFGTATVFDIAQTQELPAEAAEPSPERALGPVNQAVILA